jgi:hypothetical protein
MNALLERSRTSTGAAALVGAAIGLAAVAAYLGVGLLVADWSVGEFLAALSANSVAYFLGTIALVVAVVGLPVVAVLRFDLLAPLVILVLVVLGWLAVGAVQGLLSLRTSFGLALYAALLSPLYLALYGVLGGGEYLIRRRASRP